MADPWREVIHVQRHGRKWDLLLECGHVAVRPVRPLTEGVLVVFDKRVGKGAPERCRCLICGLGEAPLGEAAILARIEARERIGDDFSRSDDEAKP